jgi:hypothetical protein
VEPATGGIHEVDLAAPQISVAIGDLHLEVVVAERDRTHRRDRADGAAHVVIELRRIIVAVDEGLEGDDVDAAAIVVVTDPDGRREALDAASIARIDDLYPRRRGVVYPGHLLGSARAAREQDRERESGDSQPAFGAP